MIISTNQNYKEFEVLPIRSVYKTFPISWVDKNKNTLYNEKEYKSIRHHRV